jgi:hypothetical protein
MLGKLRLKRPSHATVVSYLALFVALGGTTAYAANTIGSSDVIDESLLSQDIKDGEVKTSDLKNSSVTSLKINNGSVLNAEIASNAVTTDKIADGAVGNGDLADGAVGTNKVQDGAITSAKVFDDTLTANDIATSGVNSAEIATDAVGATEIQNDSIDSGEIVDFGLSNQDIGVLFAEVQANGTLDNSSGAINGNPVTVTKLGGVGNYEVDFGRTITACTAVATIGPSGGGSAIGEVNVADRGGNAEAVFVDTNDSAGAAVDKPFRLIVVC